MAIMKNAWILKKQVASLSQGIGNTLILTPKSTLTSSLNNAAFFATKSNNDLVLPKKPLTPFFLFKEEKIKQVKRENPNMKMMEQVTIVANMWKDLAEDKKDIYKNLYAGAKDVYDKKIVDIQKDPKLSLQYAHIKEQKKEVYAKKAYDKALKQRRNLMKELGRPKRTAASAFSLFCKDNFKSFHKDGTPVPTTMKIVAEKWNSLSDAEKEPFIERYQKAKEADDAKILAWKEKVTEENEEDIAKLNAKVSMKRQLKNRQKGEEEDDTK